jgi:hypothetical protein
MSKELEALIALRSGDTYRIPGSVVLSSEQYKAIAEALTPPTEEEVIKAIEEFYHNRVIVVFKNTSFKAISNMFWPIHYFDICWYAFHNIKFSQYANFPPYLVILICQFYKDLEEKKNE